MIMEVKNISLSMIHPSVMNPRKTFDEEGIIELADNIEKQGLLQPITVRPCLYDRRDPSKVIRYEIVCGERRYRAMCLLMNRYPESHGYDEILAIPKEMNDEEAFDAMITENLQRKDVDPTEEAFAFAELVKKGKTIEEIAARFGKSIRFVTERVKLNSLVPELMLAVKEGKMPIVAALIICKLDEEQQRRYYSQYKNGYQGFVKDTAQSFIRNLFLDIDESVWFKNGGKEFDGGCGMLCQACPKNTANHGCLFYEMKCDNAGRCTDRTSFYEKTKAFLLHWLQKQSKKLVKKGDPLEYGKTVIAVKVDSYEPDDVKKLKEEVRQFCLDSGYEVVDPNNVFQGKCYYPNNDDRVKEMIKTGEVYRVINLFNYTSAQVAEQFWYVKKKATSTGKVEPIVGVPTEVSQLLDKLKAENDKFKSSITVGCANAIHAKKRLTDGPLTDLEKKLFSLLALKMVASFNKSVGLDDVRPRDEDYAYVESHPDMFDKAVRAWLQYRVGLSSDPELHQAEPLLDDLGALWCDDEYAKAKQKIIDKHENAVANITGQLAKLGYDHEGNPIIKPKSPLEAFHELKKKHPDTLLIFRTKDGYECYEQDANVAAITLGLQLKDFRPNGKYVERVSFGLDELDKYLPILVKSGKRVAIVEGGEVENVKK